MAVELVVTQNFGARKKGEVITDQTEIASVKAANPHCVVARSAAAPTAAPATPPTK